MPTDHQAPHPSTPSATVTVELGFATHPAPQQSTEEITEESSQEIVQQIIEKIVQQSTEESTEERCKRLVNEMFKEAVVWNWRPTRNARNVRSPKLNTPFITSHAAHARVSQIVEELRRLITDRNAEEIIKRLIIEKCHEKKDCLKREANSEIRRLEEEEPLLKKIINLQKGLYMFAIFSFIAFIAGSLVNAAVGEAYFGTIAMISTFASCTGFCSIATGLLCKTGGALGSLRERIKTIGSQDFPIPDTIASEVNCESILRAMMNSLETYERDNLNQQGANPLPPHFALRKLLMSKQEEPKTAVSSAVPSNTGPNAATHITIGNQPPQVNIEGDRRYNTGPSAVPSNTGPSAATLVLSQTGRTSAS